LISEFLLLLYFCEFFDSVDAVFEKISNVPEFEILENQSVTESKTNKGKRRTFLEIIWRETSPIRSYAELVLLVTKVQKIPYPYTMKQKYYTVWK
jgi:hypothetical protein